MKFALILISNVLALSAVAATPMSQNGTATIAGQTPVKQVTAGQLSLRERDLLEVNRNTDVLRLLDEVKRARQRNLDRKLMGGGDAGGGNAAALEFVTAARAAAMTVDLQRVRTNVTREKIFSAIDRASVAVSESELRSGRFDNSQVVDALNFPSSGVIILNSKRWDALKDFEAKKRLALHEVLSLIGEEYTGFYGQSAGGLQGGVNFRNATVRELPEKTQVYISFSTSFLPGHNNAEFNFNGQTHSNKSEQAYPYVAGNLAIHFAGLESNNNSSILVPRQCVVKSVDATYLYPQIVIKLQLTGPRSCDKISLEKTIYHGDLDNLLSEFARYGVYFILPPPDIIE